MRSPATVIVATVTRATVTWSRQVTSTGAAGRSVPFTLKPFPVGARPRLAVMRRPGLLSVKSCAARGYPWPARSGSIPAPAPAASARARPRRGDNPALRAVQVRLVVLEPRRQARRATRPAARRARAGRVPAAEVGLVRAVHPRPHVVVRRIAADRQRLRAVRAGPARVAHHVAGRRLRIHPRRGVAGGSEEH